VTFPPKLEALAAVSARASFFGRYGFGCDRFGILAIMLRMRRTSIRPSLSISGGRTPRSISRAR
jgi:hypothetical protein